MFRMTINKISCLVNISEKGKPNNIRKSHLSVHLIFPEFWSMILYHLDIIDTDLFIFNFYFLAYLLLTELIIVLNYFSLSC